MTEILALPKWMRERLREYGTSDMPVVVLSSNVTSDDPSDDLTRHMVTKWSREADGVVFRTHLHAVGKQMHAIPHLRALVYVGDGPVTVDETDGLLMLRGVRDVALDALMAEVIAYRKSRKGAPA